MRHPVARLQPPSFLGSHPTATHWFFARSLLIIAFAGVCRGAGPFRSLPAGLPRRPLVGPLSPVDLFPGVAAVAACAVAVPGRRRGFMPTASAPPGYAIFSAVFPADLRFSPSEYHGVPPLPVDAPFLSVHLTPRGWASAPDLLVSLVVCPGSMALSCWCLVLPPFWEWSVVRCGWVAYGFWFLVFPWVGLVFSWSGVVFLLLFRGFSYGSRVCGGFWCVVYRLAFLDCSFYP